MSRTLVTIPTYNEQENISKLIDVLFDLDKDLDILVVDDGKDKTSDVVKEKQKNNLNLFLIKRSEKSGRGKAVLEGLKFGLQKDYQYFVEMDADFSHDPLELPLLLEVAGSNTLVIGSRYAPGSKIINWPLRRRVFSYLANKYAGFVLGMGITDYTNGYRVYGRGALSKLNFGKIKTSGFIVLSEISYQLYKKGVVLKEVPTVFVNRRDGVSNFSLKEIKESFVSVLRIRKDFNK